MFEPYMASVLLGLFIMLSDDIHNWIQQEGSYLQGLALYQRTGGIKPYSHFARHANSYYISPALKTELRQELEQYLKVYPPSVVLPPEEQPTNSKEKPKVDPVAIQALRKKAIPYHKRYSHLKASLYTHAMVNQPDQVELFNIAKEIMKEVIPKLDSIYDDIRDWESTGEIPDMPKSEAEEKVIAQMKRMRSLRSRISQLKKKLKGELDEINRMNYEQELTEKELEMELLK